MYLKVDYVPNKYTNVFLFFVKRYNPRTVASVGDTEPPCGLHALAFISYRPSAREIQTISEGLE